MRHLVRKLNNAAIATVAEADEAVHAEVLNAVKTYKDKRDSAAKNSRDWKDYEYVVEGFNVAARIVAGYSRFLDGGGDRAVRHRHRRIRAHLHKVNVQVAQARVLQIRCASQRFLQHGLDDKRLLVHFAQQQIFPVAAAAVIVAVVVVVDVKDAKQFERCLQDKNKFNDMQPAPPPIF